MLKAFLTLGIPIDSSDQDIRKKYLELVKKFTPEKFPVEFQKITSAYESIKDKRNRIYSRLFSAFNDIEFENTLKELVDGVSFEKKKIGLQELLKAIKK